MEENTTPLLEAYDWEKCIQGIDGNKNN
jgi:hypothetical protein